MGPAPTAAAVRSHHERWDGLGYPDGIGKDAIPVAARLIAVADAFDAMTSERPYRPPMSLGEALARINSVAAVRYSPTVVEAAATLVRQEDDS